MNRPHHEVRDVLAAIGIEGQRTTVEPATVVYAQGDPCNSLYFLEAGDLQRVVMSRQGKYAIWRTIHGGEWFGEEALIGLAARYDTTRSVTRAQVIAVPKQPILTFLQKQPPAVTHLLGNLLHRQRRLHSELIAQMFETTEQRVARTLLQIANRGVEGGTARRVPPMSQTTLAQMVGLSRTRVNRCLMKFREAGCIAYDGASLVLYQPLVNVVHGD